MLAAAVMLAAVVLAEGRAGVLGERAGKLPLTVAAVAVVMALLRMATRP